MMDSNDGVRSAKIVLGSVQFGMHYGISNKLGVPENQDLAKLLELAANSNITLIDTAAAYGNAEERLGLYCPSALNFISKLKPSTAINKIAEEVRASLHHLNRSSFYGYLLHSFSDWKLNPRIWKEMEDLKKKALTKKIGFSLYSPSELEEIIEFGHIPDLIQVPYNLYDRRFEAVAGLIEEHGIEVHARSVFLQGLIFFDAKDLASHFEAIREKQEFFDAFSKKHKTSKLQLALEHVMHQSWISKLVVGVNSKSELQGILKALRTPSQAPLDFLSIMKEEKPSIINPSMWI